MGENEFNCRITAEAAPGGLRKIYAKLCDEEKPHAVSVRRKSRGVIQVTIYCDAQNAAYFNTVVANENKAEI